MKVPKNTISQTHLNMGGDLNTLKSLTTVSLLNVVIIHKKREYEHYMFRHVWARVVFTFPMLVSLIVVYNSWRINSRGACLPLSAALTGLMHSVTRAGSRAKSNSRHCLPSDFDSCKYRRDSSGGGFRFG